MARTNAFEGLKPARKHPENTTPSKWYRKPPAASVGFWWTPRVAGPEDYPMDLDFSERFTRPRRGRDFFPVPGLQLTADQNQTFMNFVQGVLPQANLSVIQLAAYRQPTAGPNIDANIYPGLVAATVGPLQFG